MEYKYNLEEIQTQEHARAVIEKELIKANKDSLALFAHKYPRLTLNALEGLGRLFFELKTKDNTVIKEIVTKLKTFYNIIEEQIRIEDNTITIYFSYDCAEYNKEEIYVE